MPKTRERSVKNKIFGIMLLLLFLFRCAVYLCLSLKRLSFYPSLLTAAGRARWAGLETSDQNPMKKKKNNIMQDQRRSFDATNRSLRHYYTIRA